MLTFKRGTTEWLFISIMIFMCAGFLSLISMILYVDAQQIEVCKTVAKAVCAGEDPLCRLVFIDGSRTRTRYRVHIEGDEYCWKEAR